MWSLQIMMSGISDCRSVCREILTSLVTSIWKCCCVVCLPVFWQIPTIGFLKFAVDRLATKDIVKWFHLYIEFHLFSLGNAKFKRRFYQELIGHVGDLQELGQCFVYTVFFLLHVRHAGRWFQIAQSSIFLYEQEGNGGCDVRSYLGKPQELNMISYIVFVVNVVLIMNHDWWIIAFDDWVKQMGTDLWDSIRVAINRKNFHCKLLFSCPFVAT